MSLPSGETTGAPSGPLREVRALTEPSATLKSYIQYRAIEQVVVCLLAEMITTCHQARAASLAREGGAEAGTFRLNCLPLRRQGTTKAGVSAGYPAPLKR
jgi:hypothetical protein